jgi:hypothetical protein
MRQAKALLALPQDEAIEAILALAEKAEKYVEDIAPIEKPQVTGEVR